MILFHFEKYGKSYEVVKTDHTDQKREGDSKKRLYPYSLDRIHEILDLAIGSLTEFRNKGYVALTFFTDKKGIGSFLCTLEDNKISIITALYNVNRQVNDVFRGAKHIFLGHNYRFIKPTNLELSDDRDINLVVVKHVKKRKGLKIKNKKNHNIKDVDISEDDIFKNTMRNVKRI